MAVSGELVLADRYRPGRAEAESLAARLDRGSRISPAETVRIASRCAKALHEIHTTGVAHGDVRPANLVLARGRVNLVGFRAGCIGTAAYLAPERVQDRTATVASDLYSLGVVLYQMLAGRLPFLDEEREALRAAHATAAPDQLPAHVPPALVRLCLQLLAKDPEDRPASAAHVVGRLASPRILDPWPARREARPAGASQYASAVARRTPPPRERVVTVAPGPMILLTAAAAAALCLASAQRPLENGGGGMHRVQTSVSATTAQPAAPVPPPVPSGATVTHSPAPPAPAEH
ncbi:MAG TPA: protein kinase [Actinocrinis sp.]|nr:protein kinase [Actinocrinis sp.]